MAVLLAPRGCITLWKCFTILTSKQPCLSQPRDARMSPPNQDMAKKSNTTTTLSHSIYIRSSLLWASREELATRNTDNTDLVCKGKGGEWFRILILLAELKRKQVIDAPTNHIQLALQAWVVPISAELSINQVESIPSCKCRRSLANAPSLFSLAHS